MAGNIRLGGSYAPQVRAPFVPQPSVQGNAPQLNALENLGNQMTRAAVNIDQRMEKDALKAKSDAEKEQLFLAQKSLINEQTDAAVVLEGLKTNSTLGDPNFAQNVMTEFNKRHAKLLADARASGMDPDSLQKFDLGLSELRKSVETNALGFQNDSRTTYIGTQVDDATARGGRLVFADPEQLAKTQAEIGKLFDTLPKINPVDREKMKREALNSINLMAGYGLAEKNPEGVTSALTAAPKPPSASLTPAGQAKAKNASVRLNNMGAISIVGEGNKWVEGLPGYVGKVPRPANEGGYYAKFATPEAGVHAASELLIRYGKSGVNTPARIAGRWAASPGSDYAKTIAKYTGVGINDKLDLNDPSVRIAVLMAQSQVEAAASGPVYTKEVYENGVGGKVGDIAAAMAQAGTTGNYVLDNLTGAQQLQILNAAQANVNRQSTDLKSSLSVLDTNAKEAYLSSGNYTGPMPTREAYQKAWGDVEGSQRWAQFEGYQRQGEFIRAGGTLSETDLNAKANAAKPTDTGNLFFAEQQQAYASILQARDKMLKDRKDDPVGYAQTHFPSVKTAGLAMAQNSNLATQQGYYSSLAAAYNQLGIAEEDWKAFSASTINQLQEKWKTLPPLEKVRELATLKQTTGALFNTALNDLVKGGHATEAFIAAFASSSPQHQDLLAEALNGIKKAEDLPALKPDSSKSDEAFLGLIGDLPQYMNSEILGAMQKMAIGLYVQRGGDPSKGATVNTLKGDNTPFAAAVRAMAGGSMDNPDTGIVNLGRGKVQTKTILPIGTTGKTFTKFQQNVDDGFYLLNGNGPPKYYNEKVVTAEEIERDGVFILVADDTYQIKMGSDGKFLLGGEGDPKKPYRITLRGETVQKEADKPGSTLAGGDLPAAIRDSVKADLTKLYERNFRVANPKATPAEVKAATDKFAVDVGAAQALQSKTPVEADVTEFEDLINADTSVDAGVRTRLIEGYKNASPATREQLMSLQKQKSPAGLNVTPRPMAAKPGSGAGPTIFNNDAGPKVGTRQPDNATPYEASPGSTVAPNTVLVPKNFTRPQKSTIDTDKLPQLPQQSVLEGALEWLSGGWMAKPEDGKSTIVDRGAWAGKGDLHDSANNSIKAFQNAVDLSDLPAEARTQLDMYTKALFGKDVSNLKPADIRQAFEKEPTDEKELQITEYLNFVQRMILKSALSRMK